MERGGQIQLSFGMIFSIIIIAVSIVVAFWAINNFVDLGRCTEIGIFYGGLQDEVNEIWAQDRTLKKFEGSLPGGIEEVCFGDSSLAGEEYEEIRLYLSSENNVFLSPINKACDRGGASYNLERVEIDGFFCVDVDYGGIEITLEKESMDVFVNLRE